MSICPDTGIIPRRFSIDHILRTYHRPVQMHDLPNCSIGYNCVHPERMVQRRRASRTPVRI